MKKPSQKQIEQFTQIFLKLPVDALTDQQQVAAYLGCSTAKLERDRWTGVGIPFLKVGRLVRYRKADVMAYVDGQVRSSTVEG